MSVLFAHLLVIPIVLPLVTAAILMFVGERRRRFKSLLNLGSIATGLAVVSTILVGVDRGDVGVYLASNWEAPFGIVLVADRLSALMLVLVGTIALFAALSAEAGNTRAGVHFHPLFQVQLMGLNGAFLTGDLFNLFVFFEVMLAASYGLQLHGSGAARVRSGLHYIVVNLLASSLFLVGLAVLYGVLGTLSMADIAQKFASVPARDRGLLHAGATILAMAFLVKAAVWPLNGWLVPAYRASTAPVAALFAVMTKVGIYALLRLWTLVFSAEGPSYQFGRTALVTAGLVTLAFGAVGLMASLRLGRIAGFAVIVSSGTLLAAVGLGAPPVTAAALFYLVSATPAVSALFLLVELIERFGATATPLEEEEEDDDEELDEDTNLDDEGLPLVGRAFPVSLALLGLAFMSCAVLVAGLPPLSGFLAKFSLLKAVLAVGPSGEGWALFALLLASSLAATLALARAGIRHFWGRASHAEPQLKNVEAAAVLGLLACGVLLTVWAEPVLRYTRDTAEGLHAPSRYVQSVMSKRAKPGPTSAASGQGASP